MLTFRNGSSAPAQTRGARCCLPGLLVALACLQACTASKSLSEPEISGMLDYYTQQSQQAEARRNQQREQGIQRLEFDNTSQPLAQRRVSAELQNAHVAAVLDRLGLDYALSGISRLTGRVNARFESLPTAEALAALLTPLQMQARLENGVAVISRLPQLALQMSGPDDYVLRKRVLRYADTRNIESILPTLLGSSSDDDDDDDDDGDSGNQSDTPSDGNYDTSYSNDGGSTQSAASTSSYSKHLSFAALHSENAILLTGPSADVSNALDLLDAIDTDTGHIMIEAMVLEFSASELMDIGTRINNGASGEFSNINIDWASLIGETISFTNLAGAANTRTFRAAISLLLLNNDARIVARPYLAAISGMPAKIDVAEDRYVTTFTENTGEITLEPVTSGVTMTMKPFLLPDEQIRMDLEVSVSQFVPTLGNVALARSRSDASSTMRIGSGETLVIGGLMAEQSSRSIAGVPGARSVPGLGFLFGEKQHSQQERRLLIYITPYLWEPGMDTPLDSRADLEKFMQQQHTFKSINDQAQP